MPKVTDPLYQEFSDDMKYTPHRANDIIGKRVKLYRNLHKKGVVYSIKGRDENRERAWNGLRRKAVLGRFRAKIADVIS